MQRHFDVVALLEFVDDRFDVKLARAGEHKFFCLRVAVEMKRRIFFEDLVQSAGDLVLVGARFRLDGEGDRGFRIFDRSDKRSAWPCRKACRRSACLSV